MNRRCALLLAGGAATAAACLAGSIYGAARHVPHYYAEAIQAPPDARRELGDRLLENATALASGLQKEGQWQALFTSDEINGFLSTDLEKHLPELLPDHVVEPRVRIRPGRITLAGRCLGGTIDTVVSIEAEAYVKQPNVLSIRLCRARAGALPLPMAKVLAALTKAAEEAHVQLSWLQAKGDPVAIVRLHPARDGHETRYQLETLELGEGELFVAGRTVRDQPHDSPAPPTVEPLASGKNQKRQR